MVSVMTWNDFEDIRELHGEVNYKLSMYNSIGTSSLKPPHPDTVQVIAIGHVLGAVREDYFKDMTYRYLISDKGLRRIEFLLKAINSNIYELQQQ